MKWRCMLLVSTISLTALFLIKYAAFPVLYVAKDHLKAIKYDEDARKKR